MEHSEVLVEVSSVELSTLKEGNLFKHIEGSALCMVIDTNPCHIDIKGKSGREHNKPVFFVNLTTAVLGVNSGDTVVNVYELCNVLEVKRKLIVGDK